MTYQDKKSSSAEKAVADNRHYPMNIWLSAPIKPEETDWNENSSNHRCRQSHFKLDDLPFIIEVPLLDHSGVPNEGHHGKDGANEESEESKTSLSEIEVVDPFEHERERLEPDEQETEDQCDPHVKQEYQ
jgi:hypothetical protein